MRRYLLLAHRVPVDGNFTLNDLAGGGGRMDEVARAISTAFTLSNDLRRTTELTVIFTAQPPPAARRVTLTGSRLRFLNPDERSTAALVKNALVRSARTDRDVESSPGLVAGPVDPGRALDDFCRSPGAFWLRESGVPLRNHRFDPEEFGAILSDSTDPTASEVAALENSGVPQVSVAQRSLRASQCIDVLHNEADLRERDRGSRKV